jgi:hypothetical protein
MIAAALVLSAGLFAQQQQRAFANQLDALMLPDTDRSQAHFTAFRNIEIYYPAGSSLSRLLDGRNDKIELETGNAKEVINAINAAISKEQKSPATIESDGSTVGYVAKIKGYPDRAQLSFKIDVKGNITGYVLRQEKPDGSSNGGDGEPAIVDLGWRSFSVEQPLPVKTDNGTTTTAAVDVNTPAGALAVLAPELAGKLLADPGAKAMLQDPILNFGRFGLPMKSWHFLFDVTGVQLKNYNVFREGEGRTVSIHSIGESSFREGTYLPDEKDLQIEIDGVPVRMHASTPPPSGQITIAGYSRVQEGGGGTEFALVSSKNNAGPEMGFQMQVLLVLGGMMGAVAVFVLYKSRR